MDRTKQQAEPAEASGEAGSQAVRKRRVTRREKFLSEMEQVVPWGEIMQAQAAGTIRSDLV